VSEALGYSTSCSGEYSSAWHRPRMTCACVLSQKGLKRVLEGGDGCVVLQNW
jgi:hypothetical protein